jgi:hypothetical protein
MLLVEMIWVVTPCSVAVGYQYFWVKIEAARFSETLVTYCSTT